MTNLHKYFTKELSVFHFKSLPLTCSVEEVEAAFLDGLHVKWRSPNFLFYYDKSYEIVASPQPLSAAEYYALKATVSGNLRRNMFFLPKFQFSNDEMKDFADRILKDNVLIDNYLEDIVDNPQVLNYVLNKYNPMLREPVEMWHYGLCHRSLGVETRFALTTNVKLLIHTTQKDRALKKPDSPTHDFVYGYNSQLFEHLNKFSEVAQQKLLAATEHLASLATQPIRPDVAAALEKFKLQKLVSNGKQSFVQKI